ncbi:MAG: 16S rRNA (guanine(527)-N(7))-methyltransferase RsmG [Phascolarctobacterium sp.]|uniref:16S rRNA (guanine(527)-N(7))-methyltransferase RsmG n=1 Tax=Phascolarctobacterium sp. TaxID=2049039 RepID=UPI0026DD3969|nr:16S rRNA (guanine(527)-N(7))-methyltransferase RsmG [Phascolarctobacterium sp.]MDO4922221.1 16S rRNA (guanine(527)-N(7))-methyltransferase RsmG [Phascolarctobacterium sp.]
MTFEEILAARGAEAGLSFTQRQLEQFGKYYELLVETNKVMNLTAITEPEEVAVKHMIDSLLACEAGMEGKLLADVGTGAGFPGVPLKIYRPGLKVVLIDSLGKRLKFLQQVIDALELKDICCEHLRAEDAGRNPKHREKYDFVTARAVARLSVLSEYCLPLAKKGGSFIALKGSKYADEIEEASDAVKILGGKIISAEPVKLPGLDDGRAIIKISKIKTTPAQYPRKAGTPEKQPLGGR